MAAALEGDRAAVSFPAVRARGGCITCYGLVVTLGRAFDFAFAVATSRLILAYAGSEKAAELVGGLPLCCQCQRPTDRSLAVRCDLSLIVDRLTGSTLMLSLCWLTTLSLPRRDQSIVADQQVCQCQSAEHPQIPEFPRQISLSQKFCTTALYDARDSTFPAWAIGLGRP